MQAHIQRQQADQLRAHYARVYNARPSPEILKVSAGRTSSRNNSRPGSRVTNRSSSAGRRSASSHHTAAAASNRRQQQQQQKQQRRLLQENRGGGGVARDFYYPVNPPLQQRSLSNLEISNLEKRAFKSRRGTNRPSSSYVNATAGDGTLSRRPPFRREGRQQQQQQQQQQHHHRRRQQQHRRISGDYHHPSEEEVEENLQAWDQEREEEEEDFYLTHRYLSDLQEPRLLHHHHHHQQQHSYLSSGDDDFYFSHDNLRPGFEARGGRRMRAPPHLYSSMVDINEASNGMRAASSMSEKIDQFLCVVERCEAELREEFEMRRRRVEDRKLLSRSPWLYRRSVSSSASNLGGGGGAQGRSASSSGAGNFRKPSSSSTHISGRSLNVSEVSSPKPKTAARATSSAKKKKKKPKSASSSASKLYGDPSKPPSVITERWPPQQSPAMMAKRGPTPTSSTAGSRLTMTVRSSRARQYGVKQPAPTPPTPSVNIDGVQSKLKSDRNYQPPRRKKIPPGRRKKKTLGRQQSHYKDDDEEDGEDEEDYEDDFEKEEENDDQGGEDADDDEDDDEEEEEDAAGMLRTKRWIDEQVERGMVRQKAALMAQQQNNPSANGGIYVRTHDKESSKDSAYGYSGGESRLATREPTPDTQQQQQQYRQRRRSQALQREGSHNRPPRLNTAGPSSKRGGGLGRQTSLNGTATVTGGSRDLMDSEDEKSSAYVEFVTRVTADILRKGLFTDRAIREALDRQMGKTNPAISKRELSILASKLRKEFGISNGAANGSSSLNGSMSDTNLKDLLYQPSRRNRRPQPARVEVNVVRGGGNQKTSNHAQNNASAEEMSDQELTNILYEVDLDESVVEEVLRTVRRGEEEEEGPRKVLPKPTVEGPGQLRIFDSMNISNLNISFNAAAAEKNSKKGAEPKKKSSEQRALLINSFATREAASSSSPGGGARMRPKSDAPNKSSRQRSAKAPPNSGRQDSSSSNPDQQQQQQQQQQRKQQQRSGSAKSRQRPPSSSKSRPPPPQTASPHQKQQQQQQQNRMNQLPETPLHSSETPRSSSLYHPESDEDNNKNKEKEEDNNKATADEVEDSEISDDKDEEEVVDYPSEFEDDVDEEIEEE